MIPHNGIMWHRWKASVFRFLQSPDLPVSIAFWFFGLINNVLYVIILTAALDLVGPSVPKAVVLLCDVLPGFAAKLFLPYVIQLVPYSVRVLVLVFLSVLGMSLVAYTPSQHDFGMKMAGVVLASLSSGTGELSYLGLTHYFGPCSLAAWGSGTGAAGLVGAGLYSLMTSSWGFSSQKTLSASAFLPFVMLISFFLILPKGPLSVKASWKASTSEPSPVRREEGEDGTGPRNEAEEDRPLLGETGEVDLSVMDHSEDQGRSSLRSPSPTSTPYFTTLLSRHRSSSKPKMSSLPALVMHNFSRARFLFIPYMLPLFLVYAGEYLINQSIAPVLIFPISSHATIIKSHHDFYRLYNTIYQLGVFISRSSIAFLRMHNLYAPSLLQWVNVGILVLHAIYFVPPLAEGGGVDDRPLWARILFSSVWVVFLIIFWEGLLGGAVYINTFAEISDPSNTRLEVGDKEFALGAVTVSDSAGICVAGIMGMALEVGLCSWQVQQGRTWCRE